MGIRFRKRVKIASGIHVNLSKSGASLTIGGRGGSVNIGKKGVYGNAGIPGTGIYMREKISEGKKNGRRKKTATHVDTEPSETFGCVVVPFCTVLGVAACWVFGDIRWAWLVVPILVALMFITRINSKKREEDVQDQQPTKTARKEKPVIQKKEKVETFNKVDVEKLALQYEGEEDFESAYDKWSVLFGDMCEKKEYNQDIVNKYIDCTRKTTHSPLERFIYEDLITAFPEHPDREKWEAILTKTINPKNE